MACDSIAALLWWACDRIVMADQYGRAMLMSCYDGIEIWLALMLKKNKLVDSIIHLCTLSVLIYVDVWRVGQ